MKKVTKVRKLKKPLLFDLKPSSPQPLLKSIEVVPEYNTISFKKTPNIRIHTKIDGKLKPSKSLQTLKELLQPLRPISK